MVTLNLTDDEASFLDLLLEPHVDPEDEDTAQHIQKKLRCARRSSNASNSERGSE